MKPPCALLPVVPGVALTLALAMIQLNAATNGMDAEPAADPNPPSPSPTVWTYTLLPGSQLIADWPLPIPTLLQGTFQLRWLEETAVSARYGVENLWFTATDRGQPVYHLTGSGFYTRGRGAPLVQDLFLEIHIEGGFGENPVSFTNATRRVERLWPMFQCSLEQTNPIILQRYHLHLMAAPFHEIWFSTAQGFTPRIRSAGTDYITGGALVSSAARVVQRNQDLTRRLGMMPSPDPADLGLDAIDILPGGEIAFSVQQDDFSEFLGPFHHGDLLSDRGRILADYASLSGAFGPEPPPADQGLDAVHAQDEGELWFSVAEDFFSETLSQTIRRGDVLSSRGTVVRTYDAMLARFHPPPIPHDWGLDALYVWPSGEIWFSVEEGFQDDALGWIQPGDLLSDQGHVIYRNLDLVAPFQPLEELADFGLDALFIVADLTPPPPGAPPLRCRIAGSQPAAEDVTLEWAGPGRVFQVEKASDPLGPWQPLSPILTEPPVVDAGVLMTQPHAFYRVRQW